LNLANRIELKILATYDPLVVGIILSLVLISLYLAISLSKEKRNYMTYYDNLTGLHNRGYIEKKLKRLAAERKLPISLIIADINGLKLVNDHYGHDEGDKVLVKVADVLRSTVREKDIIARYGGDEFLILLPDTNKNQAEKISKRIHKKIAETEVNGVAISLGIGLATKDRSEQNVEGTIEKADDRMYQNKLTKKRSNKNKIVKSLMSSLSAKSDETKEHAQRMTNNALKLGGKINLTNEQLNNLSLLATLHDIGKVTISEEILTKSSDLTEEEWKTIKTHPQKGYSIASSIKELAPIAKGILSHHERWDGGGYPQGLKKEEIPLLARIITIVDAYDVMVNGRVYKEPRSKTKALEELKKCAGTQFDPELVEEFIEVKKAE
jgi:diguanylate cyclase (GGDEF)-like protein